MRIIVIYKDTVLFLILCVQYLRPEKVVLRKTGTYQNSVQELTNQLTKKPYISSQQQSISGSIEGGKTGQKRELGDYHKSINTAVLGTKKEALSAIDTDKAFIEADGGRTRNLRIDSPML